jgi:hypothetical protein
MKWTVIRLPEASAVLRRANPLSRRNLPTLISAVAVAAFDITKLAGDR